MPTLPAEVPGVDDQPVTVLHVKDGSCCGEFGWENDHPYPPPWESGRLCTSHGAYPRPDCVGCPPSPIIGYYR